MKKVILGLLLITAIFLIACESEDVIVDPINGEIIDEPVDDVPFDDEIIDEPIDDVPFDDEIIDEPIDDVPVDDEILNGDEEETIETIESIQTTFEEGLFTYEIVINKPTPCHEVEVEATISEENLLEIMVMLVETDELCAQVITPETVVGEIETEEEPEDILVFLT